MKKNQKKPLVLLILDGFGVAVPGAGNAISQAKTPFFNYLIQNYFARTLRASGPSVGLPRGVFGNSEVCHLNLGAGRVVLQDLERINKAIADNSFYKNHQLLAAINHVKKNNSALHLMGLVSDGRVHSSLEHLKALLLLAKKEKIKNVYLHAFLDGRDTPYNSGIKYIKELEAFLKEINLGQIATVSGRFYAMDRDNHWERINLAFAALVSRQGEKATSAAAGIEASYGRGIFDEEVKPFVVLEKDEPLPGVSENDALVFFNYRSDRARELTRAFTDQSLKQEDLKRKKIIKNLYFVCLTEYEKKLNLPAAFPPEVLPDTLGEVLANNNFKQLRLAETEKYAHVTYFFNGGDEKPNKNEDRILIPSPRVESYATCPEMSAPKITAKFLAELKKDQYDFFVINFANADMVGHTGNVKATIKAINTLDVCLKKITTAIIKLKGQVIITADHGNADLMYNSAKKMIIKEHSQNPVPLIIVSDLTMLKRPKKVILHRLIPAGRLADVAPTILKILKIKKPAVMTGRPLI